MEFLRICHLISLELLTKYCEIQLNFISIQSIVWQYFSLISPCLPLSVDFATVIRSLPYLEGTTQILFHHVVRVGTGI